MICVSLFIVANSAARATDPPIPLHPVSDGYAVDIAYANGAVGRFLLDTGSYATFVTPRGMASLVAAGARRRQDGGVTATLKIGGARVVATLLPADPKDEHPFDPELDGALGVDLLAGFRMGLDLADPKAATMRLWPAGTALKEVLREWKGNSQRTAAVPFSLSKDGGYYVRVDLDGTPLLMCVDTGATFSCVPSKIAERLRWKRATKFTHAVTNSGATHALTYYQIDRLALGKFVLPHPVNVGALEGLDDSLLGIDALAWTRTLLDFAGERAYFAPVVVAGPP